MKRKHNLKIRPKYFLLAGILVCLALIFLSFRYSDRLEPVKNVVGGIITPMQKGLNQVGSFFAGQAERFTTMDELLEENRKLKSELEDISYENKLLQQEKYELENLRELYKLDSRYSSYEKVAARVTSKDSDNWYNIFTIDKGSDDGIKVDMNVMAGDGLVGIVTAVGHNWATVRSIIDDKSNISGMFIRSAENCIVTGNLELLSDGYIEVSKISVDADVKEGEEVYTSYISDKYLQGILIGYIHDIQVDSSGLTKSGKISPAVNFDRIDYVLVITQLKEKKY